MDAKEALRRWQEIAKRHRSGTVEVDYVTLRNGADEIERLQAENKSMRRWATAAGNAYRDVMQTLVSETAAIQALHSDDWTRAQSWATEICAAREAAEKVRDR